MRFQMFRRRATHSPLWVLLPSILFSSLLARAQDCSSVNPCATGCCNSFGYCGVGDDYCGADCVTNCDYRPDCDASNPCATGCCNKFGYCGLGPDYCADDVCVAGCDSRSECDPGGYGEFADSTKCPLNVCCSKFGFCGTTADFCGTKKVKRPECSKTGDLSRVVGYYEGWSMLRACNNFFPEQIPMGIYTHLNYAFASIDPDTFEVLIPSTYEKDLMKRLTALKKIDPDLKVFIALGGWTFNDPGPTATVFSDLARSQANQKAFFKSLISFMSTYDFDGVDLDWEYPGADDRSGRPEDYKNFPSFLANLKKSLKASGGRDGLSITLPASFWYLQHFDIANLQKHVDFFNIMSYDLHGTWDKGNKWLAPVLDSHTNLTEITGALDLLWRNDIQPEKVVLGLAFYARVFAATSPSCMSPGCTFESGGNAGPCSNEVSILLNSEIVDIMDDRNVQSTLDKDAAVKILKFDDTQWLTYDDGDTFKLKADFARSQCLGGVMVWAVSHDLPHGNFSRALGTAVGRKVTALAVTEDSDSLTVRKVHSQCKWTNCFEGCPTGWAAVPRSDDGKRENEYMWDTTACGETGTHGFCCPPDAPLPTCGWYTHHNGACDGTCPDNTVEVGSYAGACYNFDHQTACCTYDTPSMKLYSQCSWGGFPACDDAVCNKKIAAASTTGSGGSWCLARNDDPENPIQEEKYCCDESETEEWEDCGWRNDVGLASAASSSVEGFCYSGCPEERVRIALDRSGGGCQGDGGRAWCCRAKYLTISKRSYTNAESELEDSVKAFLEDPTCNYGTLLSKRELGYLDYGFGNVSSDAFPDSAALVRRADSAVQLDMQDLLSSLIVTYAANAVAQDLWNRYVVSVYPNLAVETIRAYMDTSRDWVWDGSSALVRQIICNMDYYNAFLGGTSDLIDCNCDYEDCCDFSGEECGDPDDDDSDDSDGGVLLKRSGIRTQLVRLADGGMVFFSRIYNSRGQYPLSSPLRQQGYTYRSPRNCLITNIGTRRVINSVLDTFELEHTVEIGTPAMFFRNAANGNLTSGAYSVTPAFSISFFRQALNSPILNNPPPMAGGFQSSIPIERIMDAIGSKTNTSPFTLLHKDLNGLKSRIWRNDTYYKANQLTKDIQASNPRNALKKIRSAVLVISYLNHPNVNPKLMETFNNIRVELNRANQRWVQLGNPSEHAQEKWDEWVKDFLVQRSWEAGEWVAGWRKEMTKYWAVRTGAQAAEVLKALEKYDQDMNVINQDGLD